MRAKCRVWWPKELALYEPSIKSNNFLFGWFSSCSSASIDVIVAFICDDISLIDRKSGVQDILHDTNGSMSMYLQEKSSFCLLGQYSSYSSNDVKVCKFGMVNDNCRKAPSQRIASGTKRQKTFSKYNEGRCCECSQLDGLVKRRWQASVSSNRWIQLAYVSFGQNEKDIYFIPRLHHIHWGRQLISQCDVHVILYETPIYGVHHFSLNFWSSFDQVKGPHKEPRWVVELHRDQAQVDLETVILAINSSAAARAFVEIHVGNEKPAKFSIICMFLFSIRQATAISVASISTLFYIFVQILYRFPNFGLTWICTTSARVFQIRCHQILYWSIFLQDHSLRSRSCVEYAEKAALHRHSMWSGLVVDLLLGHLIGLALLFNADSACVWVVTFANGITNELLRSGCVWLMGVPAGFKLNTELAGVLGMISLNMIQVWSTLWIFVGSLLIYFIKGLALLAIVFGATVPIALIIDMVTLATLHVSALHWAISVLYSRQIQALAALWRLFRGRKRNPLRQRLDSFDYTVKQHIVGSLLFTPLLLLLPTISAFYIFFTILDTAFTFLCKLIEVCIRMIHDTPYFEIFLWLVSRRRLPFGIWLELISCRSDYSEFMSLDEASNNLWQKKDKGEKESSILVSFLHSNFLTLGQVVLPRYKKVYSGVASFVTASSYRALTGQRIGSTFATSLRPAMPWMCIPSKEYWRLCHKSILGCMAKRDFSM